ncbi:phage tail tape measure protein [Caldifermentibacillus hisashii]|uniref:phage tail tape measure protein n=1 Tax=Caldifermentibacillus hisashii TaxID=996558 RepID=UPI0031FCE7C6
MAKQSEAKVTFKLEAEDFKKGMKELSGENTKLYKEFKLQEQQMKNTASETEKLEAKIDYLGKTQENVRKKIELTSQHLEKAKQVFGESSNEANKLSNQLLDLQIQEQKFENSIQQARSELSKQGQEMQETGKDVDKFGQKLQEIGEKANNVGDKLSVGLSAPIAAIGGIAGKSAIDLDGATRLMVGVLGATGDEAKQLESTMKSLWADGFGDNPEEIARAMLLVKQNIQGIANGEELQKITKNIILLARATDSDLGEATRGVNQLMHNFGLTAEQAFDLFVKGNQEGLNYSNEMFDNISEYAPLFRNMGFAADEYFSILANGVRNGAYNLDYVNDLMKEFNIRLQDGSKTTSDAIGKLSTSTQELFAKFEKGEVTAEDMFRTIIPELEKMDDQVLANQIGVDLFGTKFEDMGAKTVYALDDVNESFKNTSGAMKNFAKIQEEAFGQKAKKTLREILLALQPIGDELIELGEDAIPHLEKFANWISNLDEGTIKFLMTLAGSAAVVGPAAKTIGTLAEVTGSVSKLFDKANLSAGTTKAGFGATLLNLVSKAGPVGLAITALGLLAGGIYAVAKASDENAEKTLKSIDSRQKEIDSLDQTIKRFDELQGKNKLTTDEMLRYMDIMNELKEAKSEEAIQKLTDEQNKLLEKSGLTNDEMLEFLDLNDKVVEKTPATEEAISKQGNAYATTTEKVKELNDAERKRLEQDTYNKIVDGLDKQARNLEKQKELQQEIKDLEAKRKNHLDESITIGEKIKEQDLIIAGLREKMASATDQERLKYADKLLLAQQEKADLEGILQYHDGQIKSIDKTIEKKQGSLDKTKEELSAFDNLLEKYAEMVLQEQGINYEKGKAIEAIQTQQAGIDTARAKLKEQLAQQIIGRAEYEAQNAELDEQQRKIDAAKQKLSEMNVIAGTTVYKDVNISTNPTADKINRDLSQPVHKQINIGFDEAKLTERIQRAIPQRVRVDYIPSVLRGPGPRGYAKGTDFHPGGPAILAEEGPELVREGNKLSIAPTIGLYDLKRGADVFTADETEKILKGLMRLPAYATGAGIGGKLESYQNTGVNLATTPQNKLNAQFNITVISELDGREVARNQYKYVKEIDEFETNRQSQFRG